LEKGVTWFTLIAMYKSLSVAFDIVLYNFNLPCGEVVRNRLKNSGIRAQVVTDSKAVVETK